MPIPIVIINPGGTPRGRAAIYPQVEAGCEVFLNKSDFDTISKPLVPVVIGYNGRDHFCPSVHINVLEIQQWNLDIISSFCRAANEVIQEIDRKHISDAAQNQLDKLQHVIMESIPIFSGTSLAKRTHTIALRRSKRRTVPTSKLISHPETSSCTAKAGSSGTAPQSPETSSMVDAPPSPPVTGGCIPRTRKKAPKQHQCSTCGKLFSRK